MLSFKVSIQFDKSAITKYAVQFSKVTCLYLWTWETSNLRTSNFHVKFISSFSSSRFDWQLRHYIDKFVLNFGNFKWTSGTVCQKSCETHCNTGEISSNYSVKLSLSPHKSSHGTFLDSLTVDLFKIPDVNQRLKRRHTAPAFQTIFY